MSRSTGLVRGIFGVAVLLIVAPAIWAETAGEKAMKYHSVLLKRPSPGYLYDRFFNTWLETGTLADLQQFLAGQVEENDTTADRLLLAYFHAKQGDDVRALQQFRTALAKDSQNAQAWYQKAVIEARTLDFDTAIADLERARQANSDEKLAADVAKLLGKLYVRNHQTDKAMATWQALLKERPDDEELYEDVIELQIDEGLYEQAAALSEELIGRTKDKYKQVIRRVRTGDIHQRAGRRSKALEVYASTLEDVGHGTWIEREILAQIEQLFRREDDLTGLKAEYEKLLESYSKRVQVRKNYARLLSELGETEEAQKQFQEILRLTPGDRKNTEAYVSLLADSEKTAEALTVVQTLIDQHPKDGELRLRQAELHHKADDSEAASESIRKYLEVAGESEYAFLRAARMLQQFGLPDEAEETYERLVATFPESAAAKEAQAAFLYDRDKKDEALAIWKKLAAGQDRSQVVRVARILSTRNEHQAAFDLLHSRYQDFQNDPIFLGQLVTEAIAVGRYEDALPWARRRVRLAQTTSDLDTAISQVIRVAKKSESTDRLTAELRDADARPVNETCLLAELYERRGDSLSAEETLQQVEDRQNPLVANQQVRLYTQRQDWSKAIAALRRLVQMPAGRKSNYIRRLVELNQRELKFDEALAWVQEWKKLAPGSTLPWLTQSRILAQQDKLDEAIGILRAATRQFEDDQDVKARLAQLYSNAGKLADAERIFWQLYDDAKDLTSKLRWVQNLAQTAELQGKTKRLIEKFEERQRSNRQSIEPLLALAEIHRVSFNYEERRKMLLEAARIKGDDLQLLRQIARIEEKEGDWERALATLQRADELDPTTKTKEEIARLYLNYGDPDKGYAILHELVGDAKSDARSIESIAQAIMSVNDWERAAEFLAPRLNKHPDDYRLRYLLGIAQLEAGQYAQATATFAELLTDQKEIPGHVGAQPPASPWSSFLGPLESLMPKQTVEYLEFNWLKELVYSHRQGQQRYQSMMWRVSPGQTTVLVPHDVESARKYSIVHLLEIAEEGGQPQREAVIQAMREKGVPNVEILMAVAPDVNDEDKIAELAEKHPDDEGLMAMFVAMNMTDNENYDGELVTKAYELFKDRRPQLALMAAIQVAAIDEGKTELLDEALKSVDEIENPNLFLVMLIAASLEGELAAELPAKYKQPLTERLVQWYPRLKNLTPQAPMVFMYVAGAVAGADDPMPYLEFLEDEVARWRAGGQRGGQQPMGAYSGFGDEETFLQRLEFPPQTLANFPQHVSSMIRGTMDYPGASDGADLLADKVTPEVLAKIKDPTFKILLAAQYGHEQIVEETLQSMLAAEQPELDALLLAAAKAGSEGNDLLAARWLDKARFLPMSQEIRQRVDAALVATALESGAAALALAPETEDAKKGAAAVGAFKDSLSTLLRAFTGDEGKKGSMPETKEEDQLTLILELGQKAALRLRRVNLAPEQRSVLVGALEELGLESEAEKLETSIASASSSMPTPVPYGSSAQPDRITQLLNDGKRTQALRMIVNDLRAISREAFSGGDLEFDHESRQLGFVVQSHGLAEEVLAQLDPGDADNVLKLSQYGVACELLERTEKAKAAYEKALEIRPKQDALRMRLIVLLTADDVRSAMAHFRQCEPDATYQVGQALATLVHDETDLEKAVEITNALNRFVAELEEPDRHHLSWVVSLANNIAEDAFGRGLYRKDAESEESPSDTASNRLAMRRKAHADLCRTMLEIPQLAQAGFSRLLAVAERDGEVGDEFVRLARDVLLKMEDGEDIHLTTSSYGSYGYRDEHRLAFKSAAEFLVRHAWKTNNPQLIRKTIVPALKDAGKTGVAGELEREFALYTREGDEFLEHARKFYEQRSEDAYGSYDDDAMNKIIAVWNERDLKVDIQPLVDEVVNQLTGDDDYYSGSTFLYRYALVLQERNDAKRLDRFFNQLTQAFLGPQEQREAAVKQYYENESRSTRKVRLKIREYANLMEGFTSEPQTLFRVLAIMDDNGLLRELDDVDYNLRQMFSVQSSDPDIYGGYSEATYRLHSVREAAYSSAADLNIDVTPIVEVLALSPFLADLEELRVFELPDQNRSAMGLAVDQLRSLDEKSRLKICEALKKRKENPFGQRLIVTYLSSKDDDVAKAVFELLAEYADQLSAQPKAKQQEIAGMISDLLRHRLQQELSLSEGGKRARNWVENLSKGNNAELIERILAAKSWHDIEDDLDRLYAGRSSLGASLAEQFVAGGLVESNRPLARKVVVKLCSMFDREFPRRYGVDAQDLLNSFVEGVLGGSEGLAGGAFVVELMFDEQLSGLTAHSWWAQAMSRTVSSAFFAAQAAVPPDEKQPRLAAFKSLYATLGENFQSHPTTILARGYGLVAASLSETERNDFIAWADAQSKSGKYSGIARELAAAVRALGDEAQRAASRDYYLSVLQDKNLPISWRYVVAENVFPSEEGAVDADLRQLTLQSARLLQEMLKDENAGEIDASGILQSFLTLDQDDQWRTVAVALTEAWNDRYLQPSSSNMSAYGGYSSSGYNDADPEIAIMLKLNLRFENEAAVAKILRNFQDELGDRQQTLGLLVRHGRHSLAAKMLRSHWNEISTATDRPAAYSICRYDRQLHESLPEFLETISQEDLRYLGQVSLGMLPDAEGKTRQAPQPLDVRIKSLAAGFAKVNFSSPARKEKALELLASNREAAALVHEPLAKLAKDVNLAAVVRLDNDYVRARKLKLVTSFLRASLAKGDFQSVTDTVEEFSKAKIDLDDAYSYRVEVGPIAEIVLEGIKARLTDTAPQELAAILPLTRQLTTTARSHYSSDRPYAALSIVAHALAGQIDQYDKWWNGVSEVERVRYGLYLSVSVWQLAAEVFGNRDDSNLQRRIDVAEQILSSVSAKDTLSWMGSDIVSIDPSSNTPISLSATLVEISQLFTNDEFLNHGHKIAAAAPAGGMTWAALAQRQLSNGQNEAAIESWTKAIAAAPKEDNQLQTTWRMHQAKLLAQLGRAGEARKLLEDFDRSRMHAPSEEAFDNLLEKLKKQD